MDNVKVTITKQMLLDAKDYIPIAEKEEWVVDTSSKCFDRLSIAVDNEPAPDMYQLNSALKARYLMTLLVSRYFGAKYDPDPKDKNLMSEAEYDLWAGSHVFCQIDRLKRDKDVQDKCFDMLYDYHVVDKWLTAQTLGELNVRNDTVIRQNQHMMQTMQELPTLLGQLRELQEGRAGNA